MAPAVSFRIARPEAALFASDMHLDDSQPAVAEAFFDLLEASLSRALEGPQAPALFLLGDLFEYWIGDDHLPDVALCLARRLSDFSRAGGSVFLMHGNRDFLLDAPIPSMPGVQAYSDRCGATLLADPTAIEVAGRRVGLSHGDALCTDDTRYQQWRALCRSGSWQQEFLGRPVADRLALAQDLRQQSIRAQALTETVSDVNPAAVDELMSRLQTNLLVHGHTHRPMVHRWDPGAPAVIAAGCARAIDQTQAAAAEPATRSLRVRTRWVLSDWGVAPRRGSILPLTAATIASASA